MTNPMNPMGLRVSMLLAAGVTIMLALALSLGASEAPALCRSDCEGGSAVTSPTVTVSPQDGAVGVSRMTNVKVTYLEATTLSGDTFKLYPYDTFDSNCPSCSPSIPATVTGVGGNSFVLDPYGSEDKRLDANRTYVAIAPYKSWSFTTAPASAPTVTAVSPPNGATGVPTNSNIKVTFSEEMDPSTINSNTVKVTVVYYRYDRYTNYYQYVREVQSTTISKDPNDPSGRTWVIDPSLLLRTDSKVEVEIGPGVKDLSDGLSVSTYYRTSFKTASW
jgi:hypothetical protein